MKVFFVVVLVVVAGTIPSHARTESECPVFNKILPHESMNNVTVSSSHLEPYNQLYLAMQWPRSFCNYQHIFNRKCELNYFTVHGLWPQSTDGHGINCTNGPRRGQYYRFNTVLYIFQIQQIIYIYIYTHMKFKLLKI